MYIHAYAYQEIIVQKKQPSSTQRLSSPVYISHSEAAIPDMIQISLCQKHKSAVNVYFPHADKKRQAKKC